MTEKSKTTRRNSLLEFTLPNAMLDAAQTQIGPRGLSRLSGEARAKIVTAANEAATKIAGIVAEEKAGKPRSSTRRRAGSQESQSAGGANAE